MRRLKYKLAIKFPFVRVLLRLFGNRTLIKRDKDGILVSLVWVNGPLSSTQHIVNILTGQSWTEET